MLSLHLLGRHAYSYNRWFAVLVDAEFAVVVGVVVAFCFCSQSPYLVLFGMYVIVDCSLCCILVVLQP